MLTSLTSREHVFVVASFTEIPLPDGNPVNVVNIWEYVFVIPSFTEIPLPEGNHVNVVNKYSHLCLHP